jgi:DNA-binding transcriptional LysR family regulator
MADLNDILIFVKVAQFESISKAARSLGMSISTASRRLSVLESSLGASLVRRNTRRVTLTPQGREYFIQCRQPLTLLEEAERVLTQAQRKPDGILRLTVPMILGQDAFLAFLSQFSQQHAGIRIDLVITNQFLDLVADNIDLAIRFGALRESRLVASRLGKWIRHVVASPEYLQGRKVPVEPDDLKSHDCVMLNAKNNEADWDLSNGRRTVRVRVSGVMASHDCRSVTSLVLRGHGLGLLPSGDCEEALSRGDLVRLLPRWASPAIPVFAVYPSRKFLPLRVSAFLQSLARWNSPLWTRD